MADLPDHLSGGKRANLNRSTVLEDWWIGSGSEPGCPLEGTWDEMVALAWAIIEADEATR